MDDLGTVANTAQSSGNLQASLAGSAMERSNAPVQDSQSPQAAPVSSSPIPEPVVDQTNYISPLSQNTNFFSSPSAYHADTGELNSNQVPYTVASPDLPPLSIPSPDNLIGTVGTAHEAPVSSLPHVPGQQIDHKQIVSGDNIHADIQAPPPTIPENVVFHTQAPQPVPAPAPGSHAAKSSLKGLFKLVVLLAIPLVAVGVTGVVLISTNKEKAYQREKEVLVSVPMKNVNWQDLGNVFEPVIELPIKTSSSYESWEFLIDSGAVISSLPNEWAQKTGQDLAFMKRSTFRGFGGKTSFAYQGEMQVRLGEEDISLPVVFTEASGTKSLLGRKGFFENYSLYFNHKEKRIEIRK